MPTSINQLAQDVLAAAVVVLIVGGLATAVFGSFRRFMFSRVGGAIYRAATAESKAADRRASARLATADRLQEAIKDLGDAIFQGWTTQAEKAAARVRTLCPETRDAVDVLMNDVRHTQAPLEQLHKKLDAVRDSAAKCLNV
jgi:hypothetical protein